jgi:hypothetical protein
MNDDGTAPALVISAAVEEKRKLKKHFGRPPCHSTPRSLSATRFPRLPSRLGERGSAEQRPKRMIACHPVALARINRGRYRGRICQ